MILLIIYLLGIVASLTLMYRSLEKGDRVTVGDIMLALIYSLSSWVGFIIVVGMLFSNHVVFTKK